MQSKRLVMLYMVCFAELQRRVHGVYAKLEAASPKSIVQSSRRTRHQGPFCKTGWVSLFEKNNLRETLRCRFKNARERIPRWLRVDQHNLSRQETLPSPSLELAA
jgi:hypothetical protein